MFCNNRTYRCRVEAIIKYPDLTENPAQPAQQKNVSRDVLINRLNYLNFQNHHVIINLRHKDFGREISLNATPLPCADAQLDCIWEDPFKIPANFSSFQLENIIVPMGRDSLLIAATQVAFHATGITIELPDFCHKIGHRKLERYRCPDIRVSLIQNSALFQGTLTDFNALSFCVQIAIEPPQSYQWLNPELPVNILFQEAQETIFFGECRIIRESIAKQNREFVLCPTTDNTQRFKAKKSRSTRQELSPLPSMIFTHPLTKKLVNLKVVDISGSGLSVEEDHLNPLLLPGMFLKNVKLRFTNNFQLTFDGQIIHRTHLEEDDKDTRRCGIAFLDMPIDEHVQLLGLLQHACDPNAYICDNVDMEDLWHFFFESGFIYPQKYKHLQENKERAKQVYQTLYTENPNIARHFIYRDKGTILGHISTLRFYEKAWMIHHHAAKGTKGRKAGIAVLNQIGSFINDSHSIYSMHMDYVICYFRPENRFPQRVFGGVTEQLNDPKSCSIDTFVYYHNDMATSGNWDLTGPWEIKKASTEDLLDFAAYYENQSGGLLINALDLEPESLGQDNLSVEYENIGIKKDREVFAFKMNGQLKAILILNISDIAINLSELTNSLKVFVLDERTPIKALNCAITLIAGKSPYPNIPKLIFPVKYADDNALTYEKLYCLWIFKTKNSDQGLRQMRSTTRFNRQ